MRRFLSVRRAIAAFLAASVLSASPALAAEAPPTPELASWRPVSHAYAHVTLSDGAFPDPHADHAAPVVFVLPDKVWDARRVWPYLDHLSLFGVTVVELWPDDDERFGPAEAHAAIASATEAFGLARSRVALLGFGTGGRIALALARPDRPVAALYPACAGAAMPDPGGQAMVLHPDETSEMRACAALVDGRSGARSARASEGAGHGWDVVSERASGPISMPHPDSASTRPRRLLAHPDKYVTFRAVQAVSNFFLSASSARLPTVSKP